MVCTFTNNWTLAKNPKQNKNKNKKIQKQQKQQTHKRKINLKKSQVRGSHGRQTNDKSGKERREERGRCGGSRIVVVLQTHLVERSCNHSI